MSKLSRDEALELLVSDVIEWRAYKTISAPKMSTPNTWKKLNDGGWIFISGIFSRNTFGYIEHKDWLEAKKNKEKEMNEQDLMMKAVIQYKGVWPENRHYCVNLKHCDERLGLCLESYDEEQGVISYESGGIYIAGCKANKSYWQIFCTREQFESFVESIFEGAPDEAEMYVEVYPSVGCPEYKGLAYKSDRNRYELISTGAWIEEVDVEIPRPAKKLYIGDTPQQLKEGVTPKAAPYTPEIGEECEVDHGDDWIKCLYLGLDIYGNHAYQISKGDYKGEFNAATNIENFRPLQTERDQLKFKAYSDVRTSQPNKHTIEIVEKLIDAGWRPTQ